LQVDSLETAAYLLIMLAAVLRVLLPAVMPAWYTYALMSSASAWSAAFLIFLWRYTPWLVTARRDGKDG
jgi:uncharacterized protein involved in response to NO